MTNQKLENDIVRLNLSLSQEFYELLKQKSQQDYVQVGTWTKSYLMKNLIIEGDKMEENRGVIQNENN
jgi:hypothetical protein